MSTLHRFVTSGITAENVKAPLDRHNDDLDTLAENEAQRLERLAAMVDEIVADPPKAAEIRKLEAEASDDRLRYAISANKLAAKAIPAHREALNTALANRRSAKADLEQAIAKKTEQVRAVLGENFDRSVIGSSAEVVTAKEAVRVSDNDVMAVSSLGNIPAEQLQKIAGESRAALRAMVAARLQIDCPPDPHLVPVETPPQPENIRWTNRNTGAAVVKTLAQPLPVVFDSPDGE